MEITRNKSNEPTALVTSSVSVERLDHHIPFMCSAVAAWKDGDVKIELLFPPSGKTVYVDVTDPASTGTKVKCYAINLEELVNQTYEAHKGELGQAKKLPNKNVETA